VNKPEGIGKLEKAMKIMNGLVSSLSNREKRLRVALFVLPALAVVLVLLLGGVLDSDAPPKVNVSIAPVTAAALPDGVVAEVSTPAVNDGERGIEPVLGASDDFLYDMLTSNNNEVTVLAATASVDIASAIPETADIASAIPASNNIAPAATSIADVAPTPISEPLENAGSRSDAILYAEADANLSHGGAMLEI
jgi:hypothetical protein